MKMISSYSIQTQSPLHGTLYLYYPSKMIRAVIPFISGIQEGNALFYNTHGFRTAQIPYHNGSMHGISIYYNEEGSVREEIPYKSGIRYGLMKRYFPNGKIRQEIPIAHNIINGVTTLYRQNSLVLAKIVYENGYPLLGTCYSEKGNSQDLSFAKLHNWEEGIPFLCHTIPEYER
ncbi:MAG: toxin-antitoxin system YwqK family antitoxin [Desulfovibrionaceae bacterium]